MANSFAASFLGAIQAALSVLLTLFYGVLAGQFEVLDNNSTKQISSLCVKVFLPALLFSNVGKELHASTIQLYVPIIIWSLLYLITSMLMGLAMKRVFKLPSWTVVAICFNNTTSFPLLLVQTLATTGVLESLLHSSSDSASAAVSRAYSYFLINSLCCNVMTFTLGPRLLDAKEAKQNQEQVGESARENGNGDLPSHPSLERNGAGEQHADETTSLLPRPIIHAGGAYGREAYHEGQKQWDHLPPWGRNSLEFLYAFANGPMLGGILGALVGLVPPLHRAFFNNVQDGGVLNAWFTTSIQNIGDLFAALQVIVAGVKLSSCLRKMKNGENSGALQWPAVTFILAVRFVIWPAVSIGVLYLFAAKTSLLGSDPVLWFAMMLMPCGPTAMNLTALAEVAGSDENEKLSLSKFLAISYAISPIFAFTVVGSLNACQAATS